MSQFIIKRKPAYFGAARKMKVWLNGECVAKVGIGKEVVLNATEGEQEIRVSMDWCKSKPYRVCVKPDETIRLEVDTQFFLLAMFSTFFNPSSLFKVSTV